LDSGGEGCKEDEEQPALTEIYMHLYNHCSIHYNNRPWSGAIHCSSAVIHSSTSLEAYSLPSMALFQPVKLGPFQLQHRIVISPALRHVLGSTEHYCECSGSLQFHSILTRTVEELAPEGGLVLVPSLDDLGTQAHQGIVNAIHGSGGVAFSRGKMLD
jgi:hypothetical protein